jgi:hypothetical protein
MNELSKTAVVDALSPLSRDHGYIQQNPAPAYWALSPYLIHQHTDSSCSLATATMLLNGARALDGVARLGDFIGERGLLDRLGDEHWRREITPPDGNGLSTEELAAKLERCLALYALSNWSVTSRLVAAVDRPTLAALHQELAEMERKGDRLIGANYHLATTYGDDWDIGHFSPIGAYDAAGDRVLLLDVWKEDYEPCWLPLERLLAGMAIPSAKTGALRGYLVLKRA